MKASVLTNYGSPEFFELQEVAKPTPRDNEVLIKVHASSVNSWDWEILIGKPFINRVHGELLFWRQQAAEIVRGNEIATENC